MTLSIGTTETERNSQLEFEWKGKADEAGDQFLFNQGATTRPCQEGEKQRFPTSQGSSAQVWATGTEHPTVHQTHGLLLSEFSPAGPALGRSQPAANLQLVCHCCTNKHFLFP